MPINKAPQRGYQDWGRVENWDTPLIWSEVSAVTNANISSPVLDVSREAYIAGLVYTTGNPMTAAFNWYADIGATSFVANRVLTFSPSIANPAQLRIPNLGPFLVVTLQIAGAANYQGNLFLFATNRSHPLEFLPAKPQLIVKLGVALGAGASADVWPDDYYSGPVQVWMNLPAAGWLIELDSLSTTGAFNFVDRWLPAVGDNRFTTVAPAGAWKARVTNGTGAAGNYSLSMTPTTTGAL